MSKTGKIVAVVVIVLVALVGGRALFFARDTIAPPSNNQSTETDDGSNHPDAVDIVYTGYGFTPDNRAVSPGATVTIINESSRDLEFASDPYPTSIDNPEMNIGRIASGERKSFQITKAGLWGYHNHLEPGHHGRVAVLPGE